MGAFFKRSNQVGIFLALLFVLCFFWQWINPVHQELHKQILEITFFGYTGMNGISFILGLVQSYIWGFIAVVLWRISHFFCCCCCRDRCE